MPFRCLPAVVVIALASAVIAPAAPNPAAGPKPAADLPDFTGKALIVWAKDPIKGGVLQNARVRRLGDRAFLVGESAKQAEDEDDDPDCVLWIPVEDVQLIHEYKTLADARKAYANHYKKDK
jgi:hypothetical protein